MPVNIKPQLSVNAYDFPLTKTSNVFTDIRYYFLNSPKIKTLIKFNSVGARQRFSESIMQRIGIDVNRYRLLNIHQIGIEAPASYLFHELMKWNGDSLCWPNHIARVNLMDISMERIQITLFGGDGAMNKGIWRLFPFHFPQLFMLKALRIQPIPNQVDTDNARYFLYESSGGYPIGVFSIYVRTSIPERNEHEMSQLFFMVGFNFYGRTSLSKLNFINRIWEGVHNRVTANVANRFKELCEWKFENFKNPVNGQ
ncbi:MAG: hypothetical protein Q8M08_10815 [Bacteroidales bacterium]|nr:hypothetical protein [Bacteroidales bacterium]